MSKDYPWFEFTAAEWLSGDISLEEYEVKGAFIDTCAIYWKYGGELTKEKLLKRFKGNEKLIEQLILGNYIKIEREYVVIKFLDRLISKLPNYKFLGYIGSLVKKGISKDDIPKGITTYEELKSWGENRLRDLKESSPIKPPLSPPQAITIHNNTKENNINIDFDVFWDAYDKKVGKDKCVSKWNALLDEERTAIMDYIPNYKLATPDKKYRKDPKTFLSNRSWEDEIIKSQDTNIIKTQMAF